MTVLRVVIICRRCQECISYRSAFCVCDSGPQPECSLCHGTGLMVFATRCRCASPDPEPALLLDTGAIPRN